MANPLIGQILGGVLGRSMGGGAFGGSSADTGMQGGTSGPGNMGGLGSILGGMLGGGMGGMQPGGMQGGGMRSQDTGGGRTAMLAMMLPLVMQWMRRSGGIGNVLQQVNQHGYGTHASSWVGTGANEPLPPEAARRLLGPQELSSMSSQLGVGEDEVAHGFSEILPEVVDQLSPSGQVPADADQTLDAGQSSLERMLSQSH